MTRVQKLQKRIDSIESKILEQPKRTKLNGTRRIIINAFKSTIKKAT